MIRPLLSLAAAAVVIGVGVCVPGASGHAQSGQPRWVIHDLGTLGRAFISSEAVDVNESGQIVGGSGTGSLGRAFIWENGKMRQLGTLGGLESAARAINDRGQVIGGSLTRKPAKGHSFLWQNGKTTDLAPLRAIAINNRGQIVGSGKTAKGDEHAFLWQDGKLTDLGTLGGRSSSAVAVNDRGQIVGSADTKATDENGPIQHAFLWQKGKMRDLGTLGRGYTRCDSADINEGGQIVGSCFNLTISYGQLGTGQHAFLWQNGRMRDLGTLGRNPPTSRAVAINDRGWIIGNSPTSGDWRPFLWRNGKMINLGALAGGNHSEAIAINNRGQVIGDSVPRGPHGMSHAFLWQNGRMTDLGTLGGFVSVPTAINEHNQIVGSSNTARGKGHAALWTLKRGT